jgi:hypothetical protein
VNIIASAELPPSCSCSLSECRPSLRLEFNFVGMAMNAIIIRFDFLYFNKFSFKEAIKTGPVLVLDFSALENQSAVDFRIKNCFMVIPYSINVVCAVLKVSQNDKRVHTTLSLCVSFPKSEQFCSSR